MSGPIVRKYGFPNFEKIFGERPLEHGVEEGTPAEGDVTAAEPKTKPKKEKKPASTTAKKKTKPK